MKNEFTTFMLHGPVWFGTAGLGRARLGRAGRGFMVDILRCRKWKMK